MRLRAHAPTAVLALAALAAVSVDRVLYVDPAARFSVRYPRGWQAREDLFEGRVAFYRNHPREGPSFLVFPGTTLPGDLGPDRAVRSAPVAVAGLERHEHFQFRHRVTSQGLGVLSARGEARWKSCRGRNMRAAFLCVIARPPLHGGDTQLFYLLLAQAPEEEWRRDEPVFLEMLRDFKWMGG